MKRNLASCIISISLSLLLALSCILVALSPSPAAAQATTEKKIRIRSAGAPAALAWYPAAVALHNFINDHSRLDITTSSTGGPLQIVSAVTQGTADIGLQGVNNMMAFAYMGIYQFKGKPFRNMRNLILIGGMYTSFVTVPSTGVNTFYDLKGKRVAWFTSSTNEFSEGLLRVHGLDPEKDVVKRKVPSMAEAHVEIGLGRMDAANTALLPSKSLLELQEAAGRILFLPVEKEKILEGKSKFPSDFIGLVPGVFQPFMQPALKIEKALPAPMFPVGVACLESLNEEAAYLYVKTVLENVDKIRKLNPTLQGLSFENAAFTGFEVPYHKGAIRAFKEKGLWKDQQEQFQQNFFK